MLADARTNGTVGPNLDTEPPVRSLVANRVTYGKRGMPSFAGQLSEAQIRAVASYVSSVPGRR